MSLSPFDNFSDTSDSEEWLENEKPSLLLHGAASAPVSWAVNLYAVAEADAQLYVEDEPAEEMGQLHGELVGCKLRTAAPHTPERTEASKMMQVPHA